MYYCTCKSLWIEKASGGKLGVKEGNLKRQQQEQMYKYQPSTESG